MPVSALLYALLGGAGVCFTLGIGDRNPVGLLTFLALPVFFLTYTLFAITGRFVEDGTYLDEYGVTIRARGLRARIPWSSIAGAEAFHRWPFPYERIAIHLHPGAPRDVHTTVPWWIGSPRPRHDTVYLTKVQIPGMDTAGGATSPTPWINEFTRNRPTGARIETLGLEP